MDINVSAIWITLLVFAVKLVSVLCICCILNNKKVHGANFAIAWITFYLYEIAMMFALSFAKWLYTRELIIVWGISLLAVIIWLWAHKAKIRYHQRMYMSFSDIIPLKIMVAFVCIVWPGHLFILIQHQMLVHMECREYSCSLPRAVYLLIWILYPKIYL